MTRRRLRTFIDALVEGRPPPAFRARPEELDELRTAITLSAARPGGTAPDPRFVEGLLAELTELTAAPEEPGPRPLATVTQLHRRRPNAIVSLAAAAALVAGTVGVTETIDHSGAQPAATALPGHLVLTGSFETTDHLNLGHITVFGGRPSWVFMNVAGAPHDGSITCLLRAASGSVVATGTFSVQDGSGEWARTLPGGVTNLRGAQLVTSSGVTLANATFSKLSAAAS